MNFSKLSSCSACVMPQIVMSSKYANVPVSFSSLMNESIMRWKHATPFVTPNGIRVNWYRLPLDSKAVYGSSSFLIGTWW